MDDEPSRDGWLTGPASPITTRPGSRRLAGHAHLFSTIDGESPATSQGLALFSLGFHPDSSVVFYAGRAGALVDLAADLGYLHRRTKPTNRPDQPPVVLDHDLPPESVASGLSGLAEYAAIHRAIGVLLERVDSPDQAQRPCTAPLTPLV
jgi:hypothetical protein